MADNPPLPDAPLDPESVVGEHTYEEVLYAEETAEEYAPVNVLTGTRPSPPSVEKAKAFAEGDNEAPRVARLNLTGGRLDVNDPYLSSVFCSHQIVGGLETHQTMLAAWRSDDYDVDVAPDYETGDLTITIRPAEGD